MNNWTRVAFLCLSLLAMLSTTQANRQIQRKIADATDKLPRDTTLRRIDQVIRSYADLKLFNGSVLVSVKGKVVFEKGYGQADMQWEIPNSPTTKFRIGSVTKQFTAVMILQLCQAGKLDLQDKMTKYLPWYRKDTGEKITLSHLLTHTSGIPNYTEKAELLKVAGSEDSPPWEFAQKYCMGDLEFEPGARFKYNNSGYYLLGVIIETVTKKPYAQVLKEQITDKLKMKNTGLETSTELLKNKAAGYEYGFEGYAHAKFINMAATIFAAGAMYSTVKDLEKWQKALHGGELLSRKEQAALLTPNLNKYGYGVYINTFTIPGTDWRRTVVGHPGGINGFSALAVRYVEDETDVILLDNTASHRRGSLDEISVGIYQALHALPVTPPRQSISVVVTEKLKVSPVVDVVAYYKDLKRNHAARYDFSRAEAFLNNLGYYLLQKDRVKDAVSILKLGVEEYPNAANTHDTYAEALLRDGQKEFAIRHYKRSLELDPKNTNAAEQIKLLEAP